MSDIDTAVVDGLKVLDANGRLEKLPRRPATVEAVDNPQRQVCVLRARGIQATNSAAAFD